MEGLLQVLERRVRSMIEEEPDVFLVEIRVKPTNNVKVFLDSDNGMSLDRLIQYNRKIYKDLENSDLFPSGDFSLEVSSPGLDEPLKMIRQYRKNIGRLVEIVDLNGMRTEGKLIEVGEEEIKLEQETGKGKKKEILVKSVPLSGIKATRVQIKF